MALSKPRIVIYTDGACSGNPGPGGWGALLKFNDIKREIYGSEPETTNNRMEVTAAIEALRILNKSCSVEIHTDSKYLQQGISEWIYKWIRNDWRKSDNKLVKNADLWQKLLEQIANHDIIWKWVKGHSNNLGNEAADRLAVAGKENAIKALKCHS
ncbi:MAG: ribonuclease HI [Janthinobacterium lividum]